MTQHQHNIKQKNYWISKCNTKFNIQYGSKIFNFRNYSARMLQRFYHCNSVVELASLIEMCPLPDSIRTN